MIESVRKDLRPFLATGAKRRDNLALHFAKLFGGIDNTGETDQKEDLLNIMEHGFSDQTLNLYKYSMKRHHKELENDGRTLCFVMKLTSPLIVGMGEQNIHEFGISLQYPWGTPVIPGSSIKGVLSTFAHHKGDDQWIKSIFATDGIAGKNSRIMFGGNDKKKQPDAGFLDFLDAWWLPDRNPKPFKRDIITVHNSNYYEKQKGAWPNGMTSPRPVNFIVVTPGEHFLFAVRGNNEWSQLAKEMLLNLATEHGFGAKTRIGYGRFSYLPGIEEQREALKGMTSKELVDFIKKNKLRKELREVFEFKARELDYTESLKEFFLKYYPLKALYGSILAASPHNWKDIKNEYDRIKKRLPSKIDTTDPTVQQIFALCEPLAGEAQRKDKNLWLWKYAPKTMDLLVGKSTEEICEMFIEYRQKIPALKDFKETIEALECDEKSRKEILEYWSHAMQETDE
ncbi:MAG: type III-B CRISPR module RAMP protein Cmr6 [Desulfobacterales bacterium]|nr:MAG: type III-B CRISPR module RAMP protein Cmr6 [Desulfobacterales bacterium]